jgi:hypothetical protein
MDECCVWESVRVLGVETGRNITFLEKCFNFRVLRLFRNEWQMEGYCVWESLRVLREEKGGNSHFRKI